MHLKTWVFLVLKELKKIKKNWKPFKIPKLVIQTLFKEFQQIPSIFLVFYWNLNPFAPSAPLVGSQYQPTFWQEYLQNGKNKHRLFPRFFKEYSTSFLTACRLIDLALVVLKLVMLKVCVITDLSKFEFFKFSCTETVKQIDKKFRIIQNLLSL